MSKFEGSVALVTGAGRGIGGAIAYRLARDGASVLVADVDFSLATQMAEKIVEEGYRAIPIGVDVRNPEEIDRIPVVSLEMFGQIPDIVVCNAGIQTFKEVEDITLQEWDDVFKVNARGTFLTMRMAGSAMKKAGKKGSIITIASIQARMGSVYYAHYSASKAAVLSLTKSFALSLAPSGIRVNCVAPGVIHTDLWEKADHEMALLRGLSPGEPMLQRIAQVPLGRGGSPEDVAGAVVMLASDDAKYVTGECLHVCGGDVML